MVKLERRIQLVICVRLKVNRYDMFLFCASNRVNLHFSTFSSLFVCIGGTSLLDKRHMYAAAFLHLFLSRGK